MLYTQDLQPLISRHTANALQILPCRMRLATDDAVGGCGRVRTRADGMQLRIGGVTPDEDKLAVIARACAAGSLTDAASEPNSCCRSLKWPGPHSLMLDLHRLRDTAQDVHARTMGFQRDTTVLRLGPRASAKTSQCSPEGVFGSLRIIR